MDQLNAALEAKGTYIECPICDETDWTTVSDLTVITISAYAGIGDPGATPRIDVTKGFEAYCLVCDNCGFIRQHSAVQLLKGLT